MNRKAKMEKALAQKTSWDEWWLINGGQLHSYWKNKKYSAIRDAANRLPRAAWEYQENEIQRLAPLRAALIEAVEALKCNETFHRLGGIDDCEPCKALAKIDKALDQQTKNSNS